jgi:UDP-glucose 4-epimerase
MLTDVKVLVTGSSGHLGEALIRVLRADGYDAVGLDIMPSTHTSLVGSITDLAFVRRSMPGVDAVIHTATLHKPHVATHSRADFVDTNVSGTLNLLDAAVDAGAGRFVFTSTTSTFGRALTPSPGAPATWITEDVTPVPKNIYGATKIAAEDLCQLAARDAGLACVVLRTSRFFPEADDLDDVRTAYDDLNVKFNELLYRRVDLEDVVTAHQLALQRAPAIGFGRYVISATTPFTTSQLGQLRRDAPAVVASLFPHYPDVYGRLGWTMVPAIERVYVNARARHDLGWTPQSDFGWALDRLAHGEDPRTELALAVGAKGYHRKPTGVYTTR